MLPLELRELRPWGLARAMPPDLPTALQRGFAWLAASLPAEAANCLEWNGGAAEH